MRLYQYLIRDVPAEFKAQHRAAWFVYAGGRIPYQPKTMRGRWGFDVVCACGWDSHTGGAIKPSVKDDHARHIWEKFGEAK